jgi:hypothetical protein
MSYGDFVVDSIIARAFAPKSTRKPQAHVGTPGLPVAQTNLHVELQPDSAVHVSQCRCVGRNGKVPHPVSECRKLVSTRIRHEDFLSARMRVMDNMDGMTIGDHLEQFDSYRDINGKSFDELMELNLENMREGAIRDRPELYNPSAYTDCSASRAGSKFAPRLPTHSTAHSGAVPSQKPLSELAQPRSTGTAPGLVNPPVASRVTNTLYRPSPLRDVWLSDDVQSKKRSLEADDTAEPAKKKQKSVVVEHQTEVIVREGPKIKVPKQRRAPVADRSE